MRASTASIILAICAMLAVQAAPVSVDDNSNLALRELGLENAVVARSVEIEAREPKEDKKTAAVTARDIDLEAREPEEDKKRDDKKKGGKKKDDKKKGDKKASATASAAASAAATATAA